MRLNPSGDCGGRGKSGKTPSVLRNALGGRLATVPTEFGPPRTSVIRSRARVAVPMMKARFTQTGAKSRRSS